MCVFVYVLCVCDVCDVCVWMRVCVFVCAYYKCRFSLYSCNNLKRNLGFIRNHILNGMVMLEIYVCIPLMRTINCGGNWR